jgi:hypothetical protein
LSCAPVHLAAKRTGRAHANVPREDTTCFLLYGNLLTRFRFSDRLIFMSQTEDCPASDPAGTPVPPSAPKRDRSPEARRARRLKEVLRERRIVDLLNRGLPMAEIAGREGVTLNRMRKVVRDILAKRMPQAPAEYLALQVGRLNEAMFLSYGHMYSPEGGPNFKAIDSVLKIVREMDRYHGFAPGAAGAAPQPPAALPGPPLAIAPPDLDRVAIGAATD